MAVQKLGLEAFGIDLSEKARRECSEGLKGHLVMVDLNRQCLPFKEQSFELATCCEVIEHVERPYDLVPEMQRVMAKGGIVFISTPTPPFLRRWAGTFRKAFPIRALLSCT